jgi:hypothetical protein
MTRQPCYLYSTTLLPLLDNPVTFAAVSPCAATPFFLSIGSIRSKGRRRPLGGGTAGPEPGPEPGAYKRKGGAGTPRGCTVINERLARVKRQAEEAMPTKKRAPRERFTVQVDAVLAEAVRDAAYHEGVTVRGIVEAALQAELKARYAANNGGEPYPRRVGKLRTGRPSRRVPSKGKRPATE